MTSERRQAKGFTRRAVFARVFIAFSVSLVSVSAALAADDPTLTAAPRQLINETATKIVSILAKKDQTTETRISEIESLAYEIFDFTTMSKLVLARNWKKMDKAKRKEFVVEFKRHLSRTYGTRLDRYEQEEVDVYGAQVEVRNDVSVKTRILGGQFDGAEIAYRLRNRRDEWKIIDVVIEGVSLVSNYRSQFKEVLNGGSIEDLLVRLRDKNFIVDEGRAEGAAATN
ncbi:ABC transporter substrate-binding protein [Myxococcota bacterium]|nr:ABC transporter substrate-binding protein [Myxococcota bacterium]